MNIRRMQPGFAAAVAGPDRLGPIRRTPVRLELKCTSQSVAKRSPYTPGQRTRRAVGTIDHPQRSHCRKLSAQPCRKRRAFRGLSRRCKMQHVAGAQRPSAVAAKLTEGKGALLPK